MWGKIASAKPCCAGLWQEVRIFVSAAVPEPGSHQERKYFFCVRKAFIGLAILIYAIVALIYLLND